MVGGLGSVKERDMDVDTVIAKVRNEIETKAKVSEILCTIQTSSSSSNSWIFLANAFHNYFRQFPNVDIYFFIIRLNPYALTSSPWSATPRRW